MDTSIISAVPDDPVGAKLDAEISSLQSQVASLRAQRKLQATAILSSHTTQTILSRLRASKTSLRHPQTSKAPQTTLPTESNPLLSIATKQQAHNRENLYRICAGITTFRIQDPDPKAVDGGRVLGIRIDVCNSGKFIRPYYTMLNKPYKGSDLLKIHRHTLPPCIPLESLASRFLPAPKVEGEIIKGKKQDLQRFVRSLRREVIGYHNRITVIKKLRKEFKLDDDAKLSGKSKGKQREKIIVDISAADAEAKQIKIEWADGRLGRCVVGDKGEVVKCVVIGDEGRDREVERSILGNAGEARMEQIGERLREGIY